MGRLGVLRPAEACIGSTIGLNAVRLRVISGGDLPTLCAEYSSVSEGFKTKIRNRWSIRRSRFANSTAPRDLDAPRRHRVPIVQPCYRARSRPGQTVPTKIRVELVEPADEPARIRIVWPNHVSVCTPAKLDAVAANAMRVLSNAVIELAALRVWKKF